MNRDKDCPVQVALDILGGKWKLAIIHALMKKSPMRFKEIERGVKGITPRMLIKELKDLEANGLLSRKHHPTIPPMVEYSLTGTGQTAMPLVKELKKWGKKRMTGIQDGEKATKAAPRVLETPVAEKEVRQPGKPDEQDELEKTKQPEEALQPEKQPKQSEKPNQPETIKQPEPEQMPETLENQDVPPNQISLF